MCIRDRYTYINSDGCQSQLGVALNVKDTTALVQSSTTTLVCNNAGNVSLTPYFNPCLLYTSDAADERSSVDLGGRRIIKKKKKSSIK